MWSGTDSVVLLFSHDDTVDRWDNPILFFPRETNLSHADSLPKGTHLKKTLARSSAPSTVQRSHLLVPLNLWSLANTIQISAHQLIIGYIQVSSTHVSHFRTAQPVSIMQTTVEQHIPSFIQILVPDCSQVAFYVIQH